ncbi:hypothetical protein B7P43_G00318 [Cryptotermes secundus]|uniref:Uncharacterized protein n=1 Tax=Cryptotermes secundus TaxID=105785 RepID=A0A2J7PWJ7_9NEOP|nr:hypothetical protein B7P43_G00318 [Cryptotermes secundus]
MTQGFRDLHMSPPTAIITKCRRPWCIGQIMFIPLHVVSIIKHLPPSYTS